MRTKKILITSFFILLLSSYVAAQTAKEISIVVAKENKQTIVLSEIKKIFSAGLLKWGTGAGVIVVDQSDTDVGKEFYSRVLEKPVPKVRVEWTKMVLSGQASAPINCKTDDAVKNEVSKNPNAIGYILSENLDASVKEVLRIK